MENLQEKPLLSIDNVYEMALPTRCGVVFDIPHSGTHYPQDFGYSCDFGTLQQAEDTLVDAIFYNTAINCGAGAIKANFARTYVDVNRAPDDIDPIMLSPASDITCNPSARSLSGHGVFHNYIKGPIPIYDRPLSPADAKHRLETYYHPYHTALQSLMAVARNNFGDALLVDCHSMSGSSLATYFAQYTPDIVLGDLDGASCSIHIRRYIQKILTDMGYRVAVNVPFKGAEILRRFGAPESGIHAIQVEISKGLYLDENNRQKEKEFQTLERNMHALIHAICATNFNQRG